MSLTQNQAEALRQLSSQVAAPLPQDRAHQAYLDQMLYLKARNPIVAPVPAGTITQGRRHSEQQAAIQREQLAQQAAIEREQAAFRREQLAQQLALERAQMAQRERLALLTQMGAPQPSIAHAASLIKETTDAAARQGRTFTEVVRALQSPASLGALQGLGLSVDDAVRLAKQYYEPTLREGLFATDIKPQMPQPLLQENLARFIPAPTRRSLAGLSPDAHIQSITDAANLRRIALDAAILDFQRHSPQQMEHIKPGVYRDPLTNQMFSIDEHGNRLPAGTAPAQSKIVEYQEMRK